MANRTQKYAELRQDVLDKALNVLDGKVVFVEGKHDKAALEDLGVQAQIVCAHGVPLRLAEKHARACQKSGCVLLFDFDDEGKRKTSVFTELLQSLGVNPLAGVRTRIRRVFGARTIEELPAHYRLLLSSQR